jgi:hypothetical protein
MPPLLYTQGIARQYPLKRRLSRSQSLIDYYGKKEYFFILAWKQTSLPWVPIQHLVN